MQHRREIHFFLTSQQLDDGLRITTAILLPAFLLAQIGKLSVGMAISLGALAVGLADAPGPFLNRRNGMLITALLAAGIALLTTLVRPHVWLLGIEVTLAIFFFSLLQVYGMRAVGVGNSAILVLILSMGQVRSLEPFLNSLLVLAGGLWYTLIAFVFYRIRPFRPAQRVLGDCIRAMSEYLATRRRFYDTSQELDAIYKDLLAQQITVHEKQEAVREMFFKTERIFLQQKSESQKLVSTFLLSVDLFEDITATIFKYAVLRKRFAHTQILQSIAGVIGSLAGELDKTGIAIQTGTRIQSGFGGVQLIKKLNEEINALAADEPAENTLILKRIAVNLRRIAQQIVLLQDYFDTDKPPLRRSLNHALFIGHHPLDARLLLENLHPRSAVFRHALRVAIACLAGFALSKTLAYGQHSYWILLTIAFILKPAFSLTRTRNIERISGTIIGGIVAALFLYFIHNETVQFALMVLFMAGAFTFLRTHYPLMIFCTTAYIIILFHFLNIPFLTVLQERVFDTVLGGLIAFAAGYYLFPDWERGQIRHSMTELLEANAHYLSYAVQKLQGGTVDLTNYKLARKEVYVKMANLSGAFQRMLSEPKKKQTARDDMRRFVIRNHVLLSNIAHLFSLLPEEPAATYPYTASLCADAVQQLHGLSKKLDANANSQPVAALKPSLQIVDEEAVNEPEILRSSARFIVELCGDIEKTAQAILAA